MTDYGVTQVADHLRERLRSYLEAQYHIRDSGLIEERRALLDDMEAKTIAQKPFIETTPNYAFADAYEKMHLPLAVKNLLVDLAKAEPSVGVFPRPYVHQATALTAFFERHRDLIVATGTGSGKTESFLFPIAGHLALEAQERPQSFVKPGCRALLLYPMNALVSDQLSRLRRLFGSPAFSSYFQTHYERFPRFGMYTSRTPYPGSRNGKKDAANLKPLLEYYVSLEDKAKNDPAMASLVAQLKERGRWPAKDMRAFLGRSGADWSGRALTQPGDRELLTRHEMHQQCPDILVTNYSMLEYMLLRPIERNLFRQTREWLETDPKNELILVLDEAHMYRGASGAEVALLIRRLQARLGISRDRLRCILTSASLGHSDQAEERVKNFAIGLTGHPVNVPQPFELITGQKEARDPSRPGTAGEADALANVDLTAFCERLTQPEEARHTISALGNTLGWSDFVPEKDKSSPSGQDQMLQQYLYKHLNGFGPLEQIIQETSGHAVAFPKLAGSLFPDVSPAVAERAATVLLSLGAAARPAGEDKPLLPTRIHLLFRGLPPVYACINPSCGQKRSEKDQATLLGRFFTEPTPQCNCLVSARVYELLTHRDCGAAFLRVYGRGLDADFYWHEAGGTVDTRTNLTLNHLLVSEPHPKQTGNVEAIWLEMTTGRVARQKPEDEGQYRKFYRPLSSKPRDGREDPYDKCPVCCAPCKDKIMDLATKGEQPFANLVWNQFLLQPPSKPSSPEMPNEGRKVLLFSDGRQKAARLARDLPREVERDTFRQAICVSAKQLTDLRKEAKLDRTLYGSFVAACAKNNVEFFDREGASQLSLREARSGFQIDYGCDLELALDEGWNPSSPERYQQALLRQLSDKYYSLYNVCIGYGLPTAASTRLIQNRLENGPAGFPEEFFNGERLKSATAAWIQLMLDAGGFDVKIQRHVREKVNPYYEPARHDGNFSKFNEVLTTGGHLSAVQVAELHTAMRDVLAEKDPMGHPYLKPGAIRLCLALDEPWWQCQICGRTQQAPVFGHCLFCWFPDQLNELAPDHPYLEARKGYFREPVRAALHGERLRHMIAEEHTAQLSQRDPKIVYATTEEFELRFQDVVLGADQPPVDVLSCTTTMEVGIDIGSLVAVGLRNVPPLRENYQQRAGRAGRRGSALSTVVTFAQGGAHDNHYFQNPRKMISDAPREPQINIGNPRLARRHIAAYLIQTFFHETLDNLDAAERQHIEQTRSNLMVAFGGTAEFLQGSDEFSLSHFSAWVQKEVLEDGAVRAANIAEWVPDEVCLTEGASQLQEHKEAFVRVAAQSFLASLQEMAKVAIPAPESGETDDDAPNDGLLLNALFDHGLLPTYAFPTDLASFSVFEEVKDGKNRRVSVKERPQQSKAQALSEYAPGRLLVIDKETYRVGGIFTGLLNKPDQAAPLFDELQTYTYCPECTYTRMAKRQGEGEVCPVCSTPLREWEMLDPPGFSPENGRPVREGDRDQEYSQATSAQFPVPDAASAPTYNWKPLNTHGHIAYAHAVDQRLVVVNRGPDEDGFVVCELCGAAWPRTEVPTGAHPRPFLMDSYQRQRVSKDCRGTLHESLYLGSSFSTDLLLMRMAIDPPLLQQPQSQCLQDTLRTVAEAVMLGAGRVLEIDASEFSTGFRLMKAGTSDGGESLVAEIFIYDTASGGAGYAARAGDALPEILKESLSLLSYCPQNCARSCTECLRHYGNRYWQEQLDRRLGVAFLNYAVHGIVPPVASVADQAQQLETLHRYLTLEGWDSTRDTAIGNVPVPLLVRPRSGQCVYVVGTHSGLVDTNGSQFIHPLHALDAHYDVEVILLDEYLVTRDLPAAFERFRRGVSQ